jgi:predicted ATP-dependent Lon-type protease
MVIVEEKRQQPIALETEVEGIKSCLTQPEYELVADYFKRKDDLEESYSLRLKLKEYLKDKYEAPDMAEEIKELIKRI